MRHQPGFSGDESEVFVDAVDARVESASGEVTEPLSTEPNRPASFRLFGCPERSFHGVKVEVFCGCG